MSSRSEERPQAALPPRPEGVEKLGSGPSFSRERTPQEFVAPSAWRSVDFISDLHLADDTPRTFAAWRDYLMQTTADAIFILGDLFEAWVGDDARHEGFDAACATVLREAAAKRSIAFMVGNRDFLVGAAMLDACGAVALSDPTVLTAFGERVLLSHGDAWCLDDVDYQRIRARVRDPVWQAQVLGRSLAERRVMARSMRSASERRSHGREGPWFDVDAPTALRWMADADAPTLVHGHTHRPTSESLAPGFVRHVLSDWSLDHVGGERRSEILRWSGGKWARLSPTDAAIPAD